uniref:Uncharacterized protein n=1 Tax=viral metagenome TaxID=1070528 RepID=A0A6C0H7W5_9ZZZZ
MKFNNNNNNKIMKVIINYIYSDDKLNKIFNYHNQKIYFTRIKINKNIK